jgi:hypothetical protein
MCNFRGHCKDRTPTQASRNFELVGNRYRIFKRIGPDRTIVRGDSEHGNPVAISEMLHASKFDDADADTDTDEYYVFPALIVASTSPLCPRCCGRFSLFVNRQIVVLVVLVILVELAILVVLVVVMILLNTCGWGPHQPRNSPSTHLSTQSELSNMLPIFCARLVRSGLCPPSAHDLCSRLSWRTGAQNACQAE